MRRHSLDSPTGGLPRRQGPGLDAIGASTEVDLIEVQLEDPVFRVRLFELERYAEAAREKGFLLVSASPFTRSSYHAADDFENVARSAIAANE